MDCGSIPNGNVHEAEHLVRGVAAGTLLVVGMGCGTRKKQLTAAENTGCGVEKRGIVSVASITPVSLANLRLVPKS